MEMASVYDQPDYDTASLVNDDELQNSYGAISEAESKHAGKEMQSVVKDDKTDAQKVGLPGERKPHAGSQLGDKGKELRGDRSELQRSRLMPRMQSSDHFYESTENDTHFRNQGATREQIRQSRRLPNWIWTIITAVLGVDRTFVLAYYLSYAVTLFSALTFTVVGVVVVVYDIASKQTKTTAHLGFISLLIGAAWICLGIYSFQLAGRLFGNAEFATSVRTHSRTLFKISTAALLIITGFGFTGLNLYSAFDTFRWDHCHTIGLHQAVCKTMYVSRVVFSAIAMVWNLLIGCMLLSVCRTHTIGIRRFVRDLDTDAQLFTVYWREKLRRSDGEFNPETASILNNSGWILMEQEQTGSLDNPFIEDTLSRLNSIQDDVFTEMENEMRMDSPNIQRKKDSLRTQHELPEGPPIMSEEELLLCYWKISSRMRFTSRCLQRWLSSWIAFVVLWCADYVIYWLSHSPNILGIMEFLAPMFLLLVLCSAYAEANGEGIKMIRCIVPTKDRYSLLHFLNEQPLQMQVFNLSISYNAILTVLLAFSVAFSSRLILDEVMKT